MNNGWHSRPVTRCCRASGRPLLILGCCLIATGLLLLFLCIPCWAWAALLGSVLIALGYLLLRLGCGRR